jgi:DAK2 domain fusion protein YloV
VLFSLREYIDGVAFTQMLLCASDALDANKQLINELNVFPVPDGDTGTNMNLTMASAAAELRKKQPASLSAAADCAASALLRGARGNSGVILSLLFRGLAKGLKGKEKADALEFSNALADGVDAAYKAVMKPAEGTILTVSRIAAGAAVEFALNGSDIELMLVCALESAKDALAETINQNPVLQRAGVIDAGGQGYVCILDAMLASLQGRAVASQGPVEAAPVRSGADFTAFDTEEITFAFDTVFIVRKTVDKPLDLLRAYLESIGDSLVIGEDDDAFKVHVHTNTPGEALTEAQKYGTLEVAKIENMRIQHDDLAAGKAAISADQLDHEDEPAVAPAEKKFGVVSVCAGAGMAKLLTELGVDRIVTGGQTMNPSTEDILREINRTPAETVFVFPNNKNIIMAAEQCIPLTEKKVVVIPTKTVPQGVSAMLCMDTYADEAELTETFQAAMQDVHTALITYAARDSEFDGHHIQAGEYLALLDGVLLGSFQSPADMWDAMSGAFEALSPEIISIYYGEDVDEESAQHSCDLFEQRFPGAEVSLVSGGQPVYYYMISVE